MRDLEPVAESDHFRQVHTSVGPFDLFAAYREV